MTVVDCENCINRVLSCIVTITEYDDKGNPGKQYEDVFKEFCRLKFRPIGQSGGCIGCSDGKPRRQSVDAGVS